MKLSDNSTWILRLGVSEEKYIHIHPGRYSVYCIRIKASTLKTVIVSLAFSRYNNFDQLDLNLISKVRKEFILLSPLKSMSKLSTIGQLLKIF